MSRADTIADLRAATSRVQRRDPDAWMRAPLEVRLDVWREHVARYTHRLAIEGAARKHGRQLGDAFVALLAARLVAVDEQPDGTRLTDDCAAELVERWASEGPRRRAA